MHISRSSEINYLFNDRNRMGTDGNRRSVVVYVTPNSHGTHSE